MGGLRGELARRVLRTASRSPTVSRNLESSGRADEAFSRLVGVGARKLPSPVGFSRAESGATARNSYSTPVLQWQPR
jgi:hypothetical protein